MTTKDSGRHSNEEEAIAARQLLRNSIDGYLREQTQLGDLSSNERDGKLLRIIIRGCALPLLLAEFIREKLPNHNIITQPDIQVIHERPIQNRGYRTTIYIGTLSVPDEFTLPYDPTVFSRQGIGIYPDRTPMMFTVNPSLLRPDDYTGNVDPSVVLSVADMVSGPVYPVLRGAGKFARVLQMN